MKVVVEVKDTDLMFISSKPYVHSDILDRVYGDLMEYYEPNLEIVFEHENKQNEFCLLFATIFVDFSRWECKDRKIYFNYMVLD